MSGNGNVVLGYTSDVTLMLDCDLKQQVVIKFGLEYGKFHDLGGVLVAKTSESDQKDLFGNSLGNYCIIYGRLMSWEEVKWHVQEIYRLGMVNKAFTALREFGYITIRVNAKNDRIPAPRVIHYFKIGDKRGTTRFLRYWRSLKDL